MIPTGLLDSAILIRATKMKKLSPTPPTPPAPFGELRRAWGQPSKMATSVLCNFFSSFTRRINGNTLFKSILTKNISSQRFLASLPLRHFSDGTHGKDTERGVQPRGMDGEKNGNEKSEGQTEDDPYAPFPDDINPVTGERGGPKGPEPTRYGDWERKGRCIDF